MSVPAVAIEPLADSQLDVVENHARSLDEQIDTLLTEERNIIGHTLARLAVTAYPGTTRVSIRGVGGNGRFGAVLCEGDDSEKELALEPSIASILNSMLRRLPSGAITGVWCRQTDVNRIRIAYAGSASAWVGQTDIVQVDVERALTLDGGHPFQSVQDRLVAYVEEQTNHTVRGLEICTDLWDNGYFYSDLVQVDYSNGDSDEIWIEDMTDFASEIERVVGSPGPNTVVTIKRSAQGITIR